MNKPPTEGGHSHGRQLVPAVGWELSWAMGGDLHTWVLQQRSRRGTQTSYRTAGCEHVSRDNQVASSDRAWEMTPHPPLACAGIAPITSESLRPDQTHGEGHGSHLSRGSSREIVDTFSNRHRVSYF